MRYAKLLAVAAATIAVVTAPLYAQKTTPADLAGKISGSWTLNPSLSPSIKAPGRSGGRTGGPAYTLAGLAAQRGGRGGGPDSPSGPGDLTPAELAERKAIAQIEQIAPSLTIKATAESVSFVDPRGELACATNDKGTRIDTFGAPVTLKCKWDKEQLRQEFSTTRSKLTRTWEVDGSDHLVLKVRVEGIGQSAGAATAVFNRSSS
jgi:hypothetical protein